MQLELDLFSGPSARLILFPLHRRMSFIRTIAAKLDIIRTTKQRQKFWDVLIATLVDEMRAGGCSTTWIDDDLNRFWQAVDKELVCRKRNQTESGRSLRDGGAA